jgi:hypothetical protein
MNKINGLLNITKLIALALALGVSLTACGAGSIKWEEEVKLLDGRVIAVTQKNRVEEDVSREFWLTFKLPEFSNQEILWHENLRPIVINIYKNKLYVVGIPGTIIEYNQYGRKEPIYIGYRYETGKWRLIPFNEIPEAIYDTNLYFDNMVVYRKKHVSLNDKAQMVRDDRYMPHSKRIDPNYISRFSKLSARVGRNSLRIAP